MPKQFRDPLTEAGARSGTQTGAQDLPASGRLGGKREQLWNLAAGAFLFLATAAFVLWQNCHLTVLWDLSYILENSTRISQGQLPYRDFPFPYAPLTFVVQAAIIKLFGRAVIHHYWYSAAAAGCATLLTWRILLRQLAHSGLPPRVTAFLLSAPLIVLGTGSILPIPFYDSDCTLAILLCCWLLLRMERRGWPARSTFACGTLLALPVFIKQNTALAFLLATAVGIGWLKSREVLRSDTPVAPARNPNRYGLLLAGAATGLAGALILIHLTCGLGNYYRWTMQFAASRRLPDLKTMLDVYRDPALVWSFVALAAGLAMFRVAAIKTAAASDHARALSGDTGSQQAARSNPSSRRTTGALWTAWIGCALLSLPFLWPVAALVMQDNDSDRVEALLHLWPVLLATSLLLALIQLPRSASIIQMLPLLALAAIQGAFLSQQLWGSTYALWPLLILLIASILAADQGGSRRARTTPHFVFASVASVSLLIAGSYYALSHERLSYADLSGDTLEHSTLAPLRGLAMRGDWLPDFEELVSYTDREIPRGDAILTIPGEDLFYFTTGRSPRFPVIMIDRTVNPYSAEEIAELARRRNVRWVIVKRRLQLQEEPLAFRPQLMELLARDFEVVERLNNYDIYHRKQDSIPPSETF